MFGLKELKEKIEVTKTTVQCPVKNCKTKVKKITREFIKSLDSHLEKSGLEKEFEPYLCGEHGIYITPSTFIYENLKDNLLWYDDDKDLLNKILEAKRVKAQLHHDNSEDAVTWNVLRFLETSGLLVGLLEMACKHQVASPEVMYWSYSQSQQSTWSELVKARKEFGESPERSSEPDLIIKSDNALFFIEAKLTALNKSDFNKNHTAEDKKDRIRRYSKGNHFLREPVASIIDAGYYQLMRFWVIGCWIADCLDLDFYLVNLVLSEREKDIESIFKRHIQENQRRKFVRTTWEDIYKYIRVSNISGKNKGRILDYYRNKTISYEKGILQKAFSV